MLRRNQLAAQCFDLHQTHRPAKEPWPSQPLQPVMNDYDGAWKRAIGQFFFDFLAVCWPHALARVDRRALPEFLEQELLPGAAHAPRGKRFSDVVARILTCSGQTAILHIEIQACRDRRFSERMHYYHCRLLDKHACPVHSLALIADDSLSWRPDTAVIPQLDGALAFHFPIFKVSDLRDRIREMLEGDNPFSFFIAVHLLNRRTRRSAELRLEWKCRVIDLLYRHRYWSERRSVTCSA
jgi:hypothetical protein